MLILLGYLVVLGTVFGGYLMTGGSLGALYQPAELVIIAGAGIGSFIVGNNGKAIKGTLKALPLLFRRSKYTKAMYMDRSERSEAVKDLKFSFPVVQNVASALPALLNAAVNICSAVPAALSALSVKF